MPVGPNRNTQPQRVALRIDEVDIANRVVHGYDKTNVLVVATFRESPASILQVPAQNERWIAQREGMGQWRLVSRLDSADQQTWAEQNLGPGDMRIEATNIHLSGTSFATTPATADNSTKVATTAYVQSQGYLTGTTGVTSFNTRTGAVALTKADVTATGLTYSDVGALSATTVFVSSFNTRSGAVVAQTGDYTAAQVTNAADKSSASTQVFTGDIQTPHLIATDGLEVDTLSGGGAADTLQIKDTGTGQSKYLRISANSLQILNNAFSAPIFQLSDAGVLGSLTDPSSPQDAATKNYVDGQIAGLVGNTYAINQTAHGFVVGNPLIYSGTAFALAKADTADDAEVVGIVSHVTDANNFTLAVAGEISGLSGLTAGSTYFLSDTTAGAVTATAPTTNGHISKPLGVALSTTVLLFINMRGEVIQTSGTVAAPSGAIMQYAGSTVPTDWLLCDGTSYPTATYPNLFNAIGYTYGGSGANFNVPDARGRILVGQNAGTFAVLGGTGGAETVTLTSAQIPGHTHSATTAAETTDHTHTISHTHTVGVSGAAGGTVPPAPGSGSGSAAVTSSGSSAGSSGGRSASHTHTLTTDSGTGGGGSHPNLQPYLVVNQIIKT